MEKPNLKRILCSRAASATLVFLIGFFGLHATEYLMRPLADDGFYFQRWTSEQLKQTVCIEDLRDELFRSLWYLHIQPPALDALRAVIVPMCGDVEGHELITRVDAALYVVWNIVYGLMGSMIFVWISAAWPRWLGFSAAFVFLVHPAMLFYATLLDSTILSSFAVLWVFFELWKLARGTGRGLGLTAATLLLFFTRSAFQWPFVVILTASLILMRVRWRTTIVFVAVAGTVVLAYTVKQYLMFGVPYTSSFAGRNFCRSISGCPQLTGEEIERAREFLDRHPPASAAMVLSRQRTLASKNFNSLEYLESHKLQQLAFAKALGTMSVGELLEEYSQNFRIYLKPSSRYTDHVIVDRLPWRETYDWFFSHGPLLLLVAVSTVVLLIKSVRKRELLVGVGLLAPALYTVAVCVLFERGENYRFKFFLEPVIFVFVIHGFATLGGWARDRIVMFRMRET